MTSLIDFLQSLGNAATFLIVTGALVALAIALPWVRARLGLALRKEAMDGASDAYKAVVSSVIFVLAFAVYQVQSNYRDGEQLVDKEANQLSVLDRALIRFGTPDALALRGLAADYATQVIGKEWPLMQHAERSVEVDALYDTLAAKARQLAPANPQQQAQAGEVQRALDTMSDLREARLAMTQKSLPSLYWVMILALLALMLTLVSCSHASLDKLLAHAGLMCAVGLLLSLVIIIDGPFKGDTSVSPDAIARVLKVIQARHAT